MSQQTGREPELSGARSDIEKLFVYVLIDPTSLKFSHDLLATAYSQAEAKRLAEGWLETNHKNEWVEFEPGFYAAKDSSPTDLFLVVTLNQDLYKQLLRNQIEYEKWQDIRRLRRA